MNKNQIANGLYAEELDHAQSFKPTEIDQVKDQALKVERRMSLP